MRASGVSMPWSTALRTRWVSGSLTASSSVLSSSVSLPSISRRTCLAALDAEVADDAGQLRPDVVDRLHARLHDALLQLAGDEVEPLRGADQVGVVGAADVLDDLVAGQHQLADQVHQLVEQVDVHADRAVGDGATGRAGTRGVLAVGGRRRRRRRPARSRRRSRRRSPRSGRSRRPCGGSGLEATGASRAAAAGPSSPRAPLGGGGLRRGGRLLGGRRPSRPAAAAGARRRGGRRGRVLLHGGADRGDDGGDVDRALAAVRLDRGQQRRARCRPSPAARWCGPGSARARRPAAGRACSRRRG